MNFNINKLISVIVPCFNSGKTLNRTISSIKNQSWTDKEIILVNDGSNDKETLKILKDLKKDDLVTIFDQPNQGLSSARNKGVINSKGSYLFFLDADDWIESNTLEELYYYFQVNKKYAYLFTDCSLEGDIKGIRKKVFNLFEQMFINQLPYSIFIPRKIFFENGFYDEEMRLGYEDWELNVRLATNNYFGKRYEKALFHYNVSNSGMLISSSIQNHIKIWKYIKKKNRILYKPKNSFRIFSKWFFKKTNNPLLLVFVWSLILNYIPENISLKVFLFLRKFKFLFKRLCSFVTNDL